MVEFLGIWLELKLGRRALTSLEYGLIGGVIIATISVGFKLLEISSEVPSDRCMARMR